jgi:pimeloyl-ACP methyl ester carboxylesterase
MTSPGSTYVDIDGNPVHIADYGGITDSPTVVCVHGLAGSHAQWQALARALSPHCRVLAVDLPGHGRTPRLGRSSTVAANQKVLNRLLRDVIGEPVVLVGHSMGATLSVLQAAGYADTVSAMALIAPPLPRAGVPLPSRLLATQVALCAWPWLAKRTLSRRLERLGAAGFVQARLTDTCVSLDAIDPSTLDLIIELVESRAAGDDAEAAFVEAARSVGLLVARAAAYRQALAAVPAPTLLLHGDSDPLLRHHGLDDIAALRPDWRLELLEGVGHSPHLEAPARTARLIVEHVQVPNEGNRSTAVDLWSDTPSLAGPDLPYAV